jgi:hypothetical protein
MLVRIPLRDQDLPPLAQSVDLDRPGAVLGRMLAAEKGGQPTLGVVERHGGRVGRFHRDLHIAGCLHSAQRLVVGGDGRRGAVADVLERARRRAGEADPAFGDGSQPGLRKALAAEPVAVGLVVAAVVVKSETRAGLVQEDVPDRDGFAGEVVDLVRGAAAVVEETVVSTEQLAVPVEELEAVFAAAPSQRAPSGERRHAETARRVRQVVVALGLGNAHRLRPRLLRGVWLQAVGDGTGRAG